MSSAGSVGISVAMPPLDDHPSSYVVRDFVEALVRCGVPLIRLPRKVGSALARSRLPAPRFLSRLVIVPLMGPRVDTLAAASLYGQPIPFCWDVWEPQWQIWTTFLNRYRPPLVVSTARQSADYLGGTLRSSVVRHLPEAITVDRYSPGPALQDRTIDILELGRRNPSWHEAVQVHTTYGDLRHLYESVPGAFIFPAEAELVAGLAETRISVCFPSNITHRDRSGSVSTLTSRYLESIASRCLVLGEASNELSDLLGFDPVVRADSDHPWQQVRTILTSIDSYQHQVDQARARVETVGTWDFRVRQLLDLIHAMRLPTGA